MRRARARLLELAPLALVAYVPLLLTAPGKVAADTKTYLYLDPARLLSRAWSMWDPNVGLGTVTHQTIGYLWPMGPWYWFWEQVGVPDWIAQRLWLGTVMTAAGVGVVYLLRTIGLGSGRESSRDPAVFPPRTRGGSLASSAAVVAAALLYELSPYVLHYAARISVILLPWAALPWLVALVHRAVPSRSWRYPAVFALIVTTVGSVNATALVLAGLGPVLWLLADVVVTRRARWRDVGRIVVRFGALTTVCSLWWMAGLWVQGGWGIDILRYTETVETVARTSLSSEVLRGLGYWFFYGGDKLGSWIEPGRSYTQHLWLIAAGFAVPLLAFAAVAITRWRHRGVAVTMVVLGVAIAVGAHPYGSPSPAGAAFKALATSSTVGLALRSTPRAVPLVVLGLVLLIGAALTAARRTLPAVLVGLLALAGLPPLWTGEVIGENLQRDEEIPTYWQEAARLLDADGDATRVWEIPGADFASYRWGNTVDPITPGLMDRPYVARELIPYGTPPSADLLIAADRRLQEQVFDADALSPMARLFGVGDVVVRSDLQYERYRTPRPRALWAILQPTPAGFDGATAVGDPTPNDAIATLPMHDEVYLSTPSDVPDPAPVEILAVDDPLPIVRARAATAPIIVAGDGEGIVESGAVGLLGSDSVVLTSAALTDAQRAAAMDAGAVLVLTDTNRQRGRRWSTLLDNAGYTEQAGETPLRDDPSDNRLPLFPHAPGDAYTTVEQRGVRAVRATAYGNPISFTPEDRAALAIDGDVTTACQVGAFDGVGGERWRLDLDDPVTASSFELVQAQKATANRWITRLEVRLDGATVTTVDLDDRSRAPDGQRIELGGRHTFSSLELVVRADNVGRRARYDGLSGVGFAEVRVGDVRVDEVVRLPADLLRDGAAGHAVAIVLARMRSNPIEPTAADEERSMARAFVLPEPRAFRLGGEVRVSAAQPDDAVDRALGGSGVVRTSSRLTGDLTSRGSSAVDGDPTTAWTTAFGEQRGQWIEVDLPTARRITSFRMDAVDDGDHSVPTRVRVITDQGDSVEADVPNDGRVVLPEAVRGRQIHIAVVDVRETLTTDWYSGAAIPMPIAVAELGLPGRTVAGSPAAIDGGCREDLVTIDGAPIGVRLVDDGIDAARREAVRVELCAGETIRLGAGEHELRTAAGSATGFDVDRLVLVSDERGRPGRLPRAAVPPVAARDATVRVVDSSPSSVTVRIDADEPVWLVLGQSWSRGWRASDGLGESQLVDGYANGWFIEPTDGPRLITMTFTPQQTVNLMLAVSAAGVALCLVLIVRSLSPRRRPGRGVDVADVEEVWPLSPVVGARPPSLVMFAAVVGGGAVAAALVHPPAGAGIAFAIAIGVALSRGPAVLAAAAIVSLGGAALFTIAKQLRNDYPPDFGWPGFFGPAHHLAWVGLLLLASAVVTDALRRRGVGSGRRRGVRRRRPPTS